MTCHYEHTRSATTREEYWVRSIRAVIDGQTSSHGPAERAVREARELLAGLGAARRAEALLVRLGEGCL